MGITVEQHPCWTITCDRCQEALDASEYGSVTHYDTESAARQAAADQDWVEHHGVWICEECAEGYAVDVPCPSCGAAESKFCDGDDLHGWRLHDERVAAFAASVAAASTALARKEQSDA